MRRRTVPCLLASLLAVLLSVSPALATGPGMVADINTSAILADEISIDTIVLAADDGIHGAEMWAPPPSVVFVPMAHAR